MTTAAEPAAPLPPDERQVAALFGEHADKWFEFSRRVGQKPYSTWGFWDPDVTTMDQAFDRMIADVVARGRVGTGDRVLDAGCGAGASALDIQAATGCRQVVGIDIAAPLLAGGRELVARAGKQGQVQLLEMSATAMTFAPASFEVMTAIDCACYFNPKRAFLEQAWRALVPGGRLVLLDLVLGDRRGGPLARLLETGMMSTWKLPRENRMDASGLVQLLAATGFPGAVVEPVGSRMVAGAVERMSSSDYRAHYRAVFGRAGDLLWQEILRVMRWLYRRGTFEFVLVSADRGEPATPGPRH
jgi:SAM-dependent methyltransferase